MNRLLALMVAGALAVAAPAFAADAPAAAPAKNAQQTKMTECNAQAATRKATTARRS